MSYLPGGADPFWAARRPASTLGYNVSYSGCDIRATVKAGGSILPLGNVSTLSYSIHREKVPVRTLGRTYPKAYTRGPRTIAGTIVFTILEEASLIKLIQWYSDDNMADESAYTWLTDQLPPFDITVSFSNESGASSRLSLYGVEIVDEGQTQSVDDMFTENMMQYIARDIDLMVSDRSMNPPRSAAFEASAPLAQAVGTGYERVTPVHPQTVAPPLTTVVATTPPELQAFSSSVQQDYIYWSALAADLWSALQELEDGLPDNREERISKMQEVLKRKPSLTPALIAKINDIEKLREYHRIADEKAKRLKDMEALTQEMIDNPFPWSE